MTMNEPPRYLQIAHWLLERQQWMTARQVALAFDVPHKWVCDDFAVLRQRRDLFEIDESTQKCRNGHEGLVKVVAIQPYTLDGRRNPQAIHFEPTTSNSITWRDLVSRPWCQLVARAS